MTDSEGVRAVVIHPDTGKFLLLKRNDQKKEHPGRWEFPGGGLEDEKPKEGVLRELREETGLEGEISGDCGEFTWHSEYTDREIKTYSFLVEVGHKEVELSKEHVNHEWLEKEEIFKKKHFKSIKESMRKAGVEVE